MIEDLTIGQIAETRQNPSNHSGDGIVPFAVPFEIELGLFLVVFERWHGRIAG
ncbi:hypothetical protein [Mesorhizobium loti]|uniref:hypothetical protein n=1 Tax=Rhizobium loti TaxID=381 RepID=UPI00319E8610